MSKNNKDNMFDIIAKKRLDEQKEIVNSVTAPVEEQKKKQEPSKIEKQAENENEISKANIQEHKEIKHENSEEKKETKNIPKKENKVGRPKSRPYTKMSFNVPDEYLETLEVAAFLNFKGNTSSYIISLIEKDIKANGKVYEQIKNQIKGLKK